MPGSLGSPIHIIQVSYLRYCLHDIAIWSRLRIWLEHIQIYQTDNWFCRFNPSSCLFLLWYLCQFALHVQEFFDQNNVGFKRYAFNDFIVFMWNRDKLRCMKEFMKLSWKNKQRVIYCILRSVK